jgi:amidase
LSSEIDGPMTWSVATMQSPWFDAIAGHNPADPVTVASQEKRPNSYLKFLDRNGRQATRICVVRLLFIGADTDPEILHLSGARRHEATRAQIVEGVNIPEIDQIPPTKLICNRVKYDVEAYLAGLGPQAPVTNLDELLVLRKFYPSIEKWMCDVQADLPPDQNPK